MWSEKDALGAVKRYFRKDESFILIRQPHRIAGTPKPSIAILLAYLVLCLSAFFFDRIRTPLYGFAVFCASVIVFRMLAHRLFCKNYIILTQYAVYRYIRLSEPKIIQSDWSDVVSVKAKHSRVFPSYIRVTVLCKKDRLPKRAVLPQKLFRLRFGKIRMSRISIDTTYARPIRQVFAIDAYDEFMQILAEIRAISQNPFEIHEQGKQDE